MVMLDAARGDIGGAALGAVGAAIPGVSAGMVKGAGKILSETRIGTQLSGKGVEVVERWMSKAELKATKETGFLRGGREGTKESPHFVSNSVNAKPLRARERLALDRTPEVRARLEVPSGVFSESTKVLPKYKMPGGGSERVGYGQVPAKVLNEK